MPQVILLAALGAGLYAGYRAIVRAGAAMAAELERSRNEARARATEQCDEKDLGTLKYDPRSGVYRPVAPRD